MNCKEPGALKWSQITFLVKLFDDVYHVALDNLLYDANLYNELIP